MAEGGVEVECVPFEILEEYRSERRCMNCRRRTFHDMVSCDKCHEFRYCSNECLERNRELHRPQCNVIGFKKGTANVLDRDMAVSTRQKAKSLDEGDNSAANDDTPDNLDKNNEPSVGQRARGATKKRRPRKKRNRKKGKGKTSNVAEANKSSSQTPEMASSIAGGKFAGKVTIDSEVRSGASFGEGWLKSKSATDSGSVNVDATGGARVRKQQKSRFPEYDTDAESDDDGSRQANSADEVSKNINHTSSGDQVGRIKVRSATSNTGASGEIKGGTAHSTRNQGGKVKDSEPVTSETGAANTEDKRAQGHPTTTGMELVPYDKQKAGVGEAAAGGRRGGDPRKPRTLEKCLSCRRESYTMLKCSRCTYGRYCDKLCQKLDFPRHKEMCKRTARFIEGLKELPFHYGLAEVLGSRGPRISTKLRDLSSELECMFFGARWSIFLLITGPYFHPFRHGVTVMDQEGLTTHIMFYDPSIMYFHVIDEVIGFGHSIPLPRCLVPGNFILLRNACWHAFLDGTVGIRVNDLQDVHFVFMD